MKRVMFISSTGGHLSELMQLKPLFNKFDYYIVTEKNDTTIKLKKEYNDRIYYLIYGARNYMLSYMIKFPLNIIKSFYLFFKINIVTTGAHTAVPMCYIGKLFKRKIIFIETLARVESKSLSGKLVNKIADIFLVQNEELLDIYENSIYKGELY